MNQYIRARQGRRCEQLMRYAEKEVEYMEKQVQEEAENEGRMIPPGEIILPNFKELQAKRRAEAQRLVLEERAVLEKNVSDIDAQIHQIQQALLDLDGSHGAEDLSENVIAEPENSKKRRAIDTNDVAVEGNRGAGFAGPGGEFVAFPDYDGEEEPNENKKAFTLFCKRTRREVKNSMSPSKKKDKVIRIHVCTCQILSLLLFLIEPNCHLALRIISMAY